MHQNKISTINKGENPDESFIHTYYIKIHDP